MSIVIRQMIAADAMAIARQPSQRVQLGLEAAMSLEIAHDLIDGGEAWTAWRAGTPIACMGIRETFPGVQGVAWAILSEGIGAAHLAISRHARARIAGSPLVRIEAIVKSSVDAEDLLVTFAPLDTHQLLAVLLALEDAPEPRWAMLSGLKPCAVLRKFGALSEPHILLERIR